MSPADLRTGLPGKDRAASRFTGRNFAAAEPDGPSKGTFLGNPLGSPPEAGGPTGRIYGAESISAQWTPEP